MSRPSAVRVAARWSRPYFQRVMDENWWEGVAFEMIAQTSPREITVQLVPTTDHEDVVGSAMAVKPKGNWAQLRACTADLAKLKERHGKLPVWVVVDTGIDEPGLLGKGYGKALYQRLFSEIHRISRGNAYVAANLCVGGLGGTTEEALRVWRSLARSYPVSGFVLVV